MMLLDLLLTLNFPTILHDFGKEAASDLQSQNLLRGPVGLHALESCGVNRSVDNRAIESEHFAVHSIMTSNSECSNKKQYTHGQARRERFFA